LGGYKQINPASHAHSTGPNPYIGDMDAATSRPLATPRVPRWGVTDAAIGVGLALVFAALLPLILTSGWTTTIGVATFLSYLVVWVPLLGAVLMASFLRGRRSLTADFGLRFRFIDILWGLGVGLLARVAASLIEIAFYGHMSIGFVTIGDVEYNAVWLFGTLLAPILLAPLIEELFFRGLLQRSVYNSAIASSRDGLTDDAAGDLATATAPVVLAATGPQPTTGLGLGHAGQASASASTSGPDRAHRDAAHAHPHSTLADTAALAAARPAEVSRDRRRATVTAIIVSSIVFSVVHVLQTQFGVGMWSVGLSTLILGLGTGALAAYTGRLGGAIIAHATFNGLIIIAGLAVA
jgi:membrane protease YdiL (CAAX protease family)